MDTVCCNYFNRNTNTRTRKFQIWHGCVYEISGQRSYGISVYIELCMVEEMSLMIDSSSL